MILQRHPEVAKLLIPDKPYSIILAIITIIFGMTVTYFAKVNILKFRTLLGPYSLQSSTLSAARMDILSMYSSMTSLTLAVMATWLLIKFLQFFVIFQWGSHQLCRSANITPTIIIISDRKIKIQIFQPKLNQLLANFSHSNFCFGGCCLYSMLWGQCFAIIKKYHWIRS